MVDIPYTVDKQSKGMNKNNFRGKPSIKLHLFIPIGTSYERLKNYLRSKFVNWNLGYKKFIPKKVS